MFTVKVKVKLYVLPRIDRVWVPGDSIVCVCVYMCVYAFRSGEAAVSSPRSGRDASVWFCLSANQQPESLQKIQPVQREGCCVEGVCKVLSL